MPPIASCALYRQNPPLVSASMPYVRFSPNTGVPVSSVPTAPSVVVGPWFVLEPPFLELLPHADAITASAATTVRTVVARDLRLRTTVPPDSSPGSRPDLSDRCCQTV